MAETIDMKELSNIIEDSMKTVKEQLKKIHSQSDEISIADMFDMQMLMNHLNQLSEMCTSVVSAMNQAISSMASKISR